MKKRVIWMALSLGIAAMASAQVPHDVNDVLYRDLDRWAARGYIVALPPIRPYPVQLLKELLADVVGRGDPAAAASAAGYLSSLSGEDRDGRPLPFHVGAAAALRTEDAEYSLEGTPTVDFIMTPDPLISGSASLEVYALQRAPGDEIATPGVFSPYGDLVMDVANVGSLYVLQRFQSMAAVGTDRIYFQAGLSRNSFGPFFDNGVVLGPQAPRTGHFSLGYREDRWSLGVVLLELSASDNNGDGIYPDKHLILHSFDFYPSRRLEFGISETVVWGGRFEFMYLAPFQEYFASQSLTGFEDNSLFDVHGSWMPVDGLKLMGQVYVDDLSFNDMMKLQLDTKYKLAGELGARWIPEKGLLGSLAADYTAVMPYMYTHIDSGDGTTLDRYVPGTVNYQNYTSLGRGLGADLEPNSDRVSIRSSWRLLKGLELGATAELRRHGNASEDEGGSDDLDDGSIFDDGYTDTGSVTFNNETRFLTQSTIEKLLSGGLSLAWTLPTPVGAFTTQLAWTSEYGWNRDLVSGNDGLVNYLYVGASWRW